MAALPLYLEVPIVDVSHSESGSNLIGLAGFKDHSGARAKYVIDSVSGIIEERHVPSSGRIEFRGCFGFADECQVGWGLRRHVEFAALYVQEGALTVRCGADHVVWQDGRTRSERRSVAFGIKTFRVIDEERLKIARTYVFADEAHEWPPVDTMDFFLYIARVTVSLIERERFIYAWTARGNGVDTETSEFRREIAEHLAKFSSQPGS